VNKPGHFWCGECGTDRRYEDAVTEIIDGEGLCCRCNKQLEAVCNVTPISTPLMNQRIAEGILRSEEEHLDGVGEDE
tara:strand:+ start:3561 stop:3791 length:231 start_codon:yes stop_codon:yes gene_type:complete